MAYQEQDQGWSTGKKLLVGAGVVTAGAIAAVALGDFEIFNKGAEQSAEAASNAVEDSLKETAANINHEEIRDSVLTNIRNDVTSPFYNNVNAAEAINVADTPPLEAGVVTDAAKAVEETGNDLSTLKDSTAKAGEKIGAAVAATGEATGDALEAGKEVLNEGIEKGTELVAEGKAAAEKAIEDGKGWVSESPIKATVAGSAIVGTAAYIKGRSDGARAVEERHGIA